jgi:hypothetical protein
MIEKPVWCNTAEMMEKFLRSEVVEPISSSAEPVLVGRRI